MSGNGNSAIRDLNFHPACHCEGFSQKQSHCLSNSYGIYSSAFGLAMTNSAFFKVSPSVDTLLRRGIGLLRRAAARLGPLDHLDHGEEKEPKVLQLVEVVAELPIFQAVRQFLSRGVDGPEGGGRLRERRGIGLVGLLQESVSRLFVTGFARMSSKTAISPGFSRFAARMYPWETEMAPVLTASLISCGSLSNERIF